MDLNSRCMACGACENVCPTDSIRMIINERGYYAPQIDPVSCVGCGRCREVCPESELPQNDHGSRPTCYALWADKQIRLESSSGGVFSVFAKWILTHEGVVYGCAWDGDFLAEHIRIDQERDLYRLRKSKYVQSRVGYVYRDVQKDLKLGYPVLFTGVPCQIAGLMKFLGRDYPDLYTIDLACSGIGPVGVWKGYLDEIEHKYGNLSEVDCRYKRYGWKAGDIRFLFQDGYEIDSLSDPYMNGYIRGMFREPVCADCRYAEFPRCADLTLGDFWGIARREKDADDKQGTSLLTINSEKGKRLFDCVNKEFVLCKEVDFDFTYKSNMFMRSRRWHAGREDFWNYYQEGRSVMESIKKADRKRYDIGIIGDWAYHNYGAQLTYWALYRYLTDLGYDVLMIDVYGDKPGMFRENPYAPRAASKVYPNLLSMKELNNICDTFIVGSDQCWNWRLFGNRVYTYSLAFADSDRRKISYAVSFGMRSIHILPEEQRYMKYILHRFQKISVRERSGVEVCRGFFDAPADWVMDPVFLPDRTVYDELIAKSELEVPEHYIFSYVVWPTEELEELLGRLSQKTGYEVFSVAVHDAADRDQTKIEDWLKLIKHSEMVVTDSFHASCFSVILEKQVLSVSCSPKTLERMQSLTGQLGMEEPKLFSEISEWSADEIIQYISRDYQQIKKRLNEGRKQSQDWLKNALISEVNPDSGDKLFDAFGTEYIQQKLFMEKLRKEYNNRNMKGIDGQVVLFGLGDHYWRNYPRICNYVDVDYVSDNDSAKWGDVFNEKKCLSPKEVAELEKPFVIITVEDDGIAEVIKKQLMDLGIQDSMSINAFWDAAQ